MSVHKKEIVNNFIENIRKKDKSIAVIGLGYVGLPLAITFAENEFSVIGIDIDQEKFVGTRDRSWGVRPVGAYDSQPTVPMSLLSFWWLLTSRRMGEREVDSLYKIFSFPVC